MKEHRFGLIGCGSVSEFTARAISELPNARLVAVASRTEANRRKLMDPYKCEGTADYREMLARKDIDVICVCTPSGAHMEPAVEAAKAGKHVIVEKPIEITLPRADAIIRACDENKVGLCAMFPSRFAECSTVLKKAIQSGRFGRLAIGDCYNKWWRDQSYYAPGGWKGTMALDGGGACMNQGSHAIDLIQWLMGPVESISAYSGLRGHDPMEAEDTAVAAIKYANGAMGVIECATSAWPGQERRIEIHGDCGTAVMENESFLRWQFKDETEADKTIRTKFAMPAATSGGATDARAIAHNNHRAQIKDFLRALDEGGKPLVDGREGRKAVEIITAIYESAREGRPVRIQSPRMEILGG